MCNEKIKNGFKSLSLSSLWPATDDSQETMMLRCHSIGLKQIQKLAELIYSEENNTDILAVKTQLEKMRSLSVYDSTKSAEFIWKREKESPQTDNEKKYFSIANQLASCMSDDLISIMVPIHTIYDNSLLEANSLSKKIIFSLYVQYIQRPTAVPTLFRCPLPQQSSDDSSSKSSKPLQ